MDEQALKELTEYMVAEAKRNREQKYEQYRRLNPYLEKGQILFTGSSLMEYFPIVELAEGVAKKKVYNRGVGGSTSFEFLDHIDAVLFDLAPSAVFVNIGTNDMGLPDYTKEGLSDRYRTIFTKLKERLPEAKVFFLKFYPMNEAKKPHPMAFGQRTNALINEANEAVSKVAEEFGVSVLDCNAPLRDAEGKLKAEYTIDGVHLWPEAYALVFEALKPVLEAL